MTNCVAVGQRLTRPRRRATARATGHRVYCDGDVINFAAIYAFTAEGGAEVQDEVLSIFPSPHEGTLVELAYPEGRPDLARRPRPVMRGIVYLFLAGTAELLTGRGMGMVK